jgi:capsular polysaccharide biosynthesis protein
MNVKTRSKQFEFEYLLHLLHKYWLLILIIIALGCFSAICFNEFSTPLYESRISVFTWNRGIAEALREIKKDKKGKKRTKSQEIMMYNNIISQSVYLGQRLISDYKNLLNSPEVKKTCDMDLLQKGFKPPFNYNFKCKIKYRSCIMMLEVVSANKKLAVAAADSLIKAFVNEQERLMDIKYTKLMHAATIPIKPFYPPPKK